MNKRSPGFALVPDVQLLSSSREIKVVFTSPFSDPRTGLWRGSGHTEPLASPQNTLQASPPTPQHLARRPVT